MTTPTEFLVRPLVLRDEGDADRVYEMAHSLGWEFSRDNASSPASEQVREVIWNATHQLDVHLVSDVATRTHSVSVSGPSSGVEHAETLREFLIGALNPLRPEELTEGVSAAASESELAIGLVRLGMGAPRTYDSAIFELVEPGFTHQHPGIRNATVWASRFMLWPELLPALRAMQNDDPESLLRDVAGDTIILYREAGVVDA